MIYAVSFQRCRVTKAFSTGFTSKVFTARMFQHVLRQGRHALVDKPTNFALVPYIGIVVGSLMFPQIVCTGEFATADVTHDACVHMG